ncbi:MAG: PfkB family carbohydrate kinase [Pseudonocardiales bacterium]|nr:PfkB family carbohydrate kinase [Pseudonocardiales bacterium]
MGRVVVTGAVNVDMVVVTPRLPGPGETVVGGGVRTSGGGKGANAAVAAARAGARVVLVGAVGADATGAGALAELRAAGVDTTHVAELADRATGVALIVVDEAGENQIAVGAGANAHVGALPDGVLDGAGCVLVSTEIPDGAVVAAVRAAVAAGVPCVLNPAPVTAAVPALLDAGAILTPNRGELADLAARLGGVDPADVPGAARALHERSGAAVVVTLGERGALVVDGPGEPAHVPAPAVTAVDTVGAGDTFNGVLAARLADGADLRAAVQAGVTAASLAVQHPGARPAP